MSHDNALSVILGLEDLLTAARDLKEERTQRESVSKEVAKKLASLRTRLEPLRDERVLKCYEALRKKAPDLEGLREILTGTPEHKPESQVALLRELCSLAPPSRDEAQAVAIRLRQVDLRQTALAGSDAERAWQTAELLEAALRFHEGHPQTSKCPVCGNQGGLDSHWAESTRSEVNRLKALSNEAKSVRIERESALIAARKLMKEAPTSLRRGAEVGIDISLASQCWSDYESGRCLEELTAIADHLVGEHLLSLSAALQTLSAQAAHELDARQSEWREVHGPLTAFLAEATEARRHDPDVKVLKRAESWLKEASDEIRAARFLPIGQAAQTHWETLRQDSNVELGGVMLAGTGTQRRVSLDVTVDGVQGAALSVMSQGELNALALSLFLPRATLEESAFRFIVIDDPVQSMDPARVDGLARTLERVAKTRQVLVFTHDARLEEAIRRMGISADILELTRRENSIVEARVALDPVRRALEDAAALAKTPDLDPRAAARVIPGFCRIALEAAFDQVVRRVLLSRGHVHREVEERLERARTLRQKASLALFDDIEQTNVEDELRRLGGHEAVNAFKLCNKGTHGQPIADPLGLVRDTRKLASQIGKR